MPPILSLEFDDGFARSCDRVAELFEAHGLRAAFSVMAGGPEAFNPAYQQEGHGDWGQWRRLRARGHSVMPHGYSHSDKTQLPFPAAQASILKCLDVFEAELPGFRRQDAVFAFPYNRSNAALEDWVGGQLRAFRTLGPAFNPLPGTGTRKVTCVSFGPGSPEADLDAQVERLLAGAGDWLVYNLHGLDGEGWGPVGADYLDRLLGRLKGRVEILPIGAVLGRVAR